MVVAEESAPHELRVEGEQQKARLESLSPATTYTVTVVAENQVGRSQPSAPLTFTTHEETPSGHPQRVTVSS